MSRDTAFFIELFFGGANVVQKWQITVKQKQQLFDYQIIAVCLSRSVAESNCFRRFCRPLPNLSANRPCCDLRCKDMTFLLITKKRYGKIIFPVLRWYCRFYRLTVGSSSKFWFWRTSIEEMFRTGHLTYAAPHVPVNGSVSSSPGQWFHKPFDSSGHRWSGRFRPAGCNHSVNMHIPWICYRQFALPQNKRYIQKITLLIFRWLR